jgi:hypothetical protein
VRPLPSQPLQHLQQMGQRARQAVDAHYDQGVAAPEPGEQPGEFRPGAVGAAGLLLHDLGAARGLQRDELGRKVLPFGRDTGVTINGHEQPPRKSAVLMSAPAPQPTPPRHRRGSG